MISITINIVKWVKKIIIKKNQFLTLKVGDLRDK